ncbi:hypothetical protein LEP1GSC132_1827 [Leptospira kirschneri str. 200803703]|uniref:Uncharacterized protein n=1 Tax=Leptospira kirschneri str. 200802841 TaxID=1193047 RepID=A0A828Y3Z4_9LEPT|nr:hypothetical protein [Leptospira kirschneri]EKO51036.1 hypothetical protein LEP1GSC131_2415 [Leptospira kirschneri str. 200802841]EKP03566.1 hypothetical protein LEP1GSC018_3122 [Leptospira kirschneri str. 2008720114]EMO69539.1 hypothetical protein LEP1GSC132_1827 [Leptospira kirschneri str. 200803703]
MSKPSRSLFLTTLCVICFTISIPYTSIADWFCLPLSFLGMLIGIVFIYGMAAEITKRIFYKLVPI